MSAPPKRLFAVALVAFGLAFAGLAVAAIRHVSETPTVTANDKIVICHSNGPGSWVQQDPDVEGVLNGHAKHPEDIIPPFNYNGGSFPGLNWDAEGQAIYENGCVLPAPRPEPIGVFGSCVSTSGATYTAVFGYTSTNAAHVTIGVGAANGFSPGPVDRGQVTTFNHGTVPSAFTVSGIAQAELTWSVSYAGQTSTAHVTFAGCPVEPPPPEPYVTISLNCVSNGATTYDAVFGYDNGGQATVNVSVGPDNSVTPGGPDRGQPESFLPGTVAEALTVEGVPNDTSVEWMLTSGGSTAKATASASAPDKCGGGPTPTPEFPVSPLVKCVDNHGSTFEATFGYSNPNAESVTQPIGPANSVSPGGPGRGQPETFEPGVVKSAFTVTGIPADGAATWTLTTLPLETNTASATSSFATKCTEPPEVPAIGIFVRCVSNRGGTFDATFGYQNDNLREVSIPVGDANRFFPAPLDRGQTTNFQPGNVQDAFTVTGIPAAQVVVWTLTSNGTRTAAASAAFESKCSDPPPSAKPIGVFVTCIDKHGSTYDATFGYENDNSVAQTIPVGPANFFSPAPSDRGQPTIFAPGRNVAAITVRGIPTSGQLTWTLAYAGTRATLATTGSSATATPSTPSCTPSPPTPPEPPGPKPPEPPRPLGVFAACVLNNGATYDAVFGYDNLNVGDVVIPIGDRNRVRPGNADQGQPETFRPGLVIAAFAVRAVPVGRPVAWQVTFGDETRVAVATAAFAQKCQTTPIVGLADLSVTKTAKPAVVNVGERVVFTIVAKNIGRRPMTPVVITDFLRDNRVARLSAATTLGTCRVLGASQRAIACGRGTLAPGESALVQIAGRAVALGRSVDQATTIFSRIADPTPRNNVAEASVRIRAPAPTPTKPRRKPGYTG